MTQYLSQLVKGMLDSSLLLLCGLPAAGKTTLAHQHLNTMLNITAFHQRGLLREFEGIDVRVVSFDDVEDEINESETFNVEKWHEAREKSFDIVKAMINKHR